MLILNTIFIFISTGLLVYCFSILFFSRSKVILRLDKYLNPSNENEVFDVTQSTEKFQLRKILSILGEKLGSIMVMKGYIRKVQEELIKAGLPLKGEEFLAIQSLLVIAVFSIFLNTSNSVIVAFIVGAIGGVLPKLIVNLRKNKRYKLFNEQLGDAIVLISNSLKAGHSFLQAIDSVSNEMPQPIAKEFEKVLKEMRLGVVTEKALENLLARVESDDLELMVTAVMIQRQIGGNLSEILDNLANTIRERVNIKGEIHALTAQGRLSGIIISLLPIVIGVVLYVINPEYLLGLFNSSLGIIIIGAAIINQIIGIVIINKIVNIEV